VTAAAEPKPVAHSEFLPPGFAQWREVARQMLADRTPPDVIVWSDVQHSIDLLTSPVTDSWNGKVPRSFMQVALSVACHRDPARWDMLYRALWRITRGERDLLGIATDPLVHQLLERDKAVRRAAHKMKAFVRFRRVPNDDRYVAWFEPAHAVVERTTPFFVDRFANMNWSILTPDRCVHWDGENVAFTSGVARSAAPAEDSLEDLWSDYYASVFNPARMAPRVMQAQMPKQYWHNLPEARRIAELSRDAPARVQRMIVTAAQAPRPLPRRLERTRSVVGRARALEFPSWDLRYDPGHEAAKLRADALSPSSGLACECGPVRVMPGVAGWTDPTLLAPGVFYPEDAGTPEDRLRFYASRFSMVEVDSTYYSLPRRENSVRWAERTPPGFIFNVKANALMTQHPVDPRSLPDWLRREIPNMTHGERLYGSSLDAGLLDEVWGRYLHALEPLSQGGKLGAVFLQFPRWFVPDCASEEELARCARRLGEVRGAIEFRNPAWVATPERAERTFGLLRDLGLAYTVVDAPPGTGSSMPPVVAVTRDDFAVVRLHGRRVSTWEARNPIVTERYRYLYDREQIEFWADRAMYMTSMMGPGLLQVAYNNNHANYATTNAAEFGEELERRGARIIAGQLSN
jgi:probable DNA metabolism protein